MSAWKWVGLAGVIGATAIGIAAGTRAARRRREFSDPGTDELRARLRERLAEAETRQTD